MPMPSTVTGRVGPVTRSAAVLAAAALAGVLTAAPAGAHTSLAGADPARGATVPSPARIRLTYTDPVTLPRVIVLDSRGGHHEAGRAQAAGNHVTQRVAGPLAPGVYTVGWRVVAEDGHPATGEYRFTVVGRAASGSPSPAGRASSTGSSALPASPSAGIGNDASPRRTSGPGWGWVGLAALLAGAVAGGVALVRRRR